MPTIKSKLLAVNDTAFTTEDAVVNIAVLANDLPAGTPKTLYSLAQSGTAVVTKATTKLGATITMNPNGTVNYDPTGDAAIQALAQGETATDTFIYTMKEANTLYTASVSVTLTGANDPSVISGTKANQSTTDTVPISPFSGVAITDVDHGAQDSITITFNGANGTLSGTGLTGSNGTYTLAATSPDALTSELDQIVFTPTAHQGAAGTTITTNFTLTATDDKLATTSNSTTSVVTTESAPTIVAYTVTIVDVPNAHNTEGSDINDNGEVVGTYFSPRTVTGDVISDGYTYLNGKITTIDRPGATNTQITSVNNEGDLAGKWNSGGTTETAFVEHNGFFTDFSIPDATIIIEGMNNSQVVVGSEVPSIVVPGQQAGFTYDNVTGNVTLIRHGTDPTAAFDINDSGVVGGSYFNGIDHGFLYQNGAFTPFNISDPSGILSTEIISVNNKGDFAGTYHEGGTTRGFLHIGDPSGGTTTLFDMSDVTGLSNDDVVSGRVSPGNAAVYTGGKIIQLVFNGQGGSANAINNNNVVAGTVFDNASVSHGFFGTPVTA